MGITDKFGEIEDGLSDDDDLLKNVSFSTIASNKYNPH